MKCFILLFTIIFLLTNCTDGPQSSGEVTAPLQEESETIQDDLKDPKIEPTIESEVDTAESRGKLAKLLPNQVEQLLSSESKSPNLGIERQPIVIPAYIPPGFEVSSLKISAHDEQYLYNFYKIKYQNKDNSCFLIQDYALDGPVGEGPAVVDEIEGIQIPALNVLVNLGYSGFSRASSYDFTIVSFTGIGGHEYEFLSPSLSENSSPDCTGIPIKESIKIVESLQYLDPKDTKVFQIKDDDVILIDDLRKLAN
ncbi:MAG: hypothetical protein AAFN93_23255 [Bacteroidota bacterium]